MPTPLYNPNAFGFVTVLENNLPRSITGIARVPCNATNRYVGPHGYRVESCEHAGFMQCGVSICILSRVTCVLDEAPQCEPCECGTPEGTTIEPEASSGGIPVAVLALGGGIIIGHIATRILSSK